MTDNVQPATSMPPPPIVFTDAAADKVGELIKDEDNPNLMLRVFISGGGCSGFQYGFTFDETIEDGDSEVENRGVKLLVDPIKQGGNLVVIDLQDGFDGETVILQVDGNEVFQGTDVRTRYQIGLAHTVNLELTPGPHRLSVALPNRNLTATAEFDPQESGFIGISRLNNRLEIKLSGQQFLYA